MSKRILIYWMIILGVVVGLNAYVANNPMYQSKTGKIDHVYSLIKKMSADDELANALVIGNSYVQASFQPDRIDFGGYHYQKLVVNGMPLSDLVGIITNLPEGRGIRRVLAGIPYVYATPAYVEASFYEMYWNTNPVASWWWSLPVVRGRSMAARILTRDAKCLVLRNPTDCADPSVNEADGLIPGVKFDAVDAEALARGIRVRLNKMRVYTSYVSAAFREEIAYLGRTARDKDLELFLYTAPLAPGFLEQLDPEFITEFRETIHATGIPYTDMNELAGHWDYTYFFDPSHVGLKGGKFTTNWLLKDFLR